MLKVIRMGCVYNNPNNRPESGRGAVYSTYGIAPTIVTMSGGGNHPFVVVPRKETYENCNKCIDSTER